MSSNDLSSLVKKYVAHHARYQEAARIVARHKKIQEKLKAMFAEEQMTEFNLASDGYDATLAFRPIQSTRIDTQALPPEIRQQYTRPVIMRKEYLTIRRAPLG
jgi:hypothetical protein